MKLTNRYGLPEPLLLAIQNDPYDDGGADISVTRLIAPPQLVTLTARHGENLSEDIADRLWATFGQLMHLLLERAAKSSKVAMERYITEKRLKAVVSIPMPDGTVKNVVLSGQLDLYDSHTKTLQDYKFVGEYALKMAEAEGKPEWEAQLNILRWLLFQVDGILAEKLEDVCLVRDYNARSLKPAGVVPMNVWDLNATEAYIIDRLRLHLEAQAAPDDKLPRCTDEERWFNARSGEFNRCKKYCPVRGVCKQNV